MSRCPDFPVPDYTVVDRHIDNGVPEYRRLLLIRPGRAVQRVKIQIDHAAGLRVIVDDQPVPDLEAFACANGFHDLADFTAYLRGAGLTPDAPFIGALFLWGHK
ncbi:MAG: hypothetical protein HQL39_19850 [Alphaproteobacteria bacterium]|nr:hypothetical protein [Alphaproteobacteria bacterium]